MTDNKYQREYYKKHAVEINKRRRVHWQEIKDSVNAIRQQKFQENKESIAHIILNGKTKKVQLNRQKSETCDICHRRVKRRNAHHFSYGEPSKDWITVCTACHVIIHMTMWGNKYSFGSIDEWYEAYKKAIESVV